MYLQYAQSPLVVQQLPPPPLQQSPQQPPVSITVTNESTNIVDDISELRTNYSPAQSRSPGNSKISKLDKMEEYAPDLVLDDVDSSKNCSTSMWNIFAFLTTFIVPDVCVPRDTTAAKQAWREKVAICWIFLLCSAGFAAAVVLPVFYCTESTEYFDSKQIEAAGFTTVFGHVYDLGEFAQFHPGGSKSLDAYASKDASALFPRMPVTDLPSTCLNPMLNETIALELQNVTCPHLEYNDIFLSGRDAACHSSVVGVEDRHEKLGDYEKGRWVIGAYDIPVLAGEMDYVVIDDIIYNVTSYVDRLRLRSRLIDPEHETNDYAVLSPVLHNLIVNRLNEDSTALFYELFSASDREAFRGPPFVKEDETQVGVMVMVPCYNEGSAELRKTINSVLKNEYPDENKVVVVVADGVITGKDEKQSTPEVLGKILGFDFDPADASYPYQSQGDGEKQTNYVSLYSGVYTNADAPGKKLNYVVIVKQGGEKERFTPRAGNRGKRDSQLLLFGLLNRMQYNRRPTGLDDAFSACLNDLELPLSEIMYLQAVDADTRLADTALKYLVHRLETNSTAIACCGETRVDNTTQSFVAMLQVFEYYSSHHIKK
ncbi:MAG: hypothetical protein SGILL_008620, partial [Bacillariaceae sp.]